MFYVLVRLYSGAEFCSIPLTSERANAAIDRLAEQLRMGDKIMWSDADKLQWIEYIPA